MNARRRWTVWIILLAATLAAVVWVDDEPDEAEIVAPALEEHTVAPAALAPIATERVEKAWNRASDAPKHALPVSPPQGEPIDPFAAKSWYVPPPALPPEPPAKPTAPPLPFRYLGTLEGGAGQWLVQLAWGNEGIVAGKGEVVGDLYRLEGLEQSNLVFTYLPMGTRQLLPATLDSD